MKNWKIIQIYQLRYKLDKHHSKYRATRDLYEITSSGLTHSLGDDAPVFLRYITKFYQSLETDEITQCMYNNKNFGEIEIT